MTGFLCPLSNLNFFASARGSGSCQRFGRRLTFCHWQFVVSRSTPCASSWCLCLGEPGSRPCRGSEPRSWGSSWHSPSGGARSWAWSFWSLRAWSPAWSLSRTWVCEPQAPHSKSVLALWWCWRRLPIYSCRFAFSNFWVGARFLNFIIIAMKHSNWNSNNFDQNYSNSLFIFLIRI